MAQLSADRLSGFFQKTGSTPQVNHRSHTRYHTYAKVKIRGIMEHHSLLKDISVTGCRVECTSLADIQVDSPYTLEVIPELGSKIGRFELEVKAVWISTAGYSGDVGFVITASPKGRLFQRYVDYLSWKGNHE
jgi:hypothetical protein